MDGIQIREFRESRILSQEALARSLGVAVRTVARWESGASKPSPLAAEKLRRELMSVESSGENGIRGGSV